MISNTLEMVTEGKEREEKMMFIKVIPLTMTNVSIPHASSIIHS